MRKTLNSRDRICPKLIGNVSQQEGVLMYFRTENRQVLAPDLF